MMTDDERTKLERMLQHDDDGSRKLAHMLKLLTELRSAVDDRPDHALLLAEEVYATFDSLPAELRQMIDEKFRRMEATDLDPLRRSSMSDKESLGEGRRQIGMKLRAAREEAEMELVELSVRTGFSEEEIEAIENGEQMIFQPDLMVLCTALEVSPKDIVGRSTN